MSVRILIGDVRDRLRELEDESVDCVVTSPPYWGMRDYDVDGQIGMEPSLGEHLDVMVDVFRQLRRVVKPKAPVWLNYGDCYASDGKWGGETGGKQAYLDDNNRKRVGREKRTTGLKPKDLCLLPFRLAIRLQEDGWWIRSRCMWGKPNGMPDSSGKYRPSVAHEEILLLGRSGDLFYDAEAVAAPVSGNTHSRVARGYKMPDNWDTGAGGHGNRHRNGREKGRPAPKQDGYGRRHAGFNERYFGKPGVTPKSAGEDTNVRASTTAIVDTRYLRTYEPEVWHIATAAYADAHFATFPPALVERCLLAGLPKGRRCVVLDPFGGSGTVGLVADRMGHDAILIELNADYAEQARKRIHGDAPMFADVRSTASEEALV